MVEINAYLLTVLGDEAIGKNQLEQLAKLTTEQREALELQMLFYPNGRRRDNGLLRYNTLMKRVDSLWSQKNKKCKIRHRFIQFSPDQSPFYPHAIGSLRTYKRWQKHWNHVLADLKPSRLSVRDCLAYGILSLCLQNRITSKTLLSDVMKGECFRLMMWRNKIYFEYSPYIAIPPEIKSGKQRSEETPEKKDKNGSKKSELSGRLLNYNQDIPVMRFRISAKTAALFDRFLGIKQNAMNVENRELSAHKGVFESLGTDNLVLSKIIEHLTPTIHQANILSFPAVIAAYLDGRFRSASLSWVDIVRLEAGEYMALPSSDNEPDPWVYTADSVKELAQRAVYRYQDAQPKDDLIQLAHEFLRDIRACFPQSKGVEKAATDHQRRQIHRNIGRVLKAHEGQVSSAIHLLGQWAQALVYSKKADGKFVSVRGTAYTYLSKLAPRFEGCAYDTDLFALEPDSITELYQDILAYRTVKDHAYIAMCLKKFHRWVQGMGIEDPDWSELPAFTQAWLVSPGIVTEQDYQAALQLLIDSAGEDRAFYYNAALLLLFYYRYALRPGEGLGLSRKDIQRLGEEWILLIRNNPYRTTKVPKSSRRQLPLLFHLSDREKHLLDYAQLHAETVFSDDYVCPVFGAMDSPRQIVAAKELKKVITLVLKQVTGNPKATLYDLRHTTACRLTIALNDLDLPGWERLPLSDNSVDDRGNIARVIKASTVGITRRNPMAVARFMGHGHAGTSHRSYLHLFSTWSDQLISLPEKNTRVRLKQAIILDDFPRFTPIRSFPKTFSLPSTQRPSMERILGFMHLLARGKKADDIGATLGFAPEFTHALTQILEHVGNTLQSGRVIRQKSKSECSPEPLDYLRKLSEDNWLLIQNKVTQQPPESPDTPEYLSELGRMISRNQQIALWRPAHFQLLRDFIRFLSLNSSQYYLFYSRSTSPVLREWAESEGFNPARPKDTLDYRTFQIDNIVINDEGDTKKNLCTFITREGRFTLRIMVGDKHKKLPMKRTHLVVMFLAFASAHCDIVSTG